MTTRRADAAPSNAIGQLCLKHDETAAIIAASTAGDKSRPTQIIQERHFLILGRLITQINVRAWA
jgi:hypothetical protein